MQMRKISGGGETRKGKPYFERKMFVSEKVGLRAFLPSAA